MRTLLLAAALCLGAFAQTPPASSKKAAPPAAAKTVPASERCIAKTADGDQCKRKAQDGSKYCWQHDPNRKKAAKKKA